MSARSMLFLLVWFFFAPDDAVMVKVPQIPSLLIIQDIQIYLPVWSRNVSTDVLGHDASHWYVFSLSASSCCAEGCSFMMVPLLYLLLLIITGLCRLNDALPEVIYNPKNQKREWILTAEGRSTASKEAALTTYISDALTLLHTLLLLLLQNLMHEFKIKLGKEVKGPWTILSPVSSASLAFLCCKPKPTDWRATTPTVPVYREQYLVKGYNFSWGDGGRAWKSEPKEHFPTDYSLTFFCLVGHFYFWQLWVCSAACPAPLVMSAVAVAGRNSCLW